MNLLQQEQAAHRATKQQLREAEAELARLRAEKETDADIYAGMKQKLEAEVQRLRADRDEARMAASELLTALGVAKDALAIERAEVQRLREVQTPPPPTTSDAACMDCGRPYAEFPLDVLLPRHQWLDIHPADGGVLCPNCLVARAAKLPGAVAVHAVIGISAAQTPQPMKEK